MTPAVNGIVLLNKPQGWTSRKAVNVVRRLFSRVKAGHTGTLDPLATGMLPIMLGKATRFASIGLDADKAYEVEIDLSLQTDTLDLEGEKLESFSDMPEQEAVYAAVKTFLGQSEQIPPQFSAIRVDGKRAHAMARAGESFELAARSVILHQVDVLSYQAPVLSLYVRCSKGTYIRSLARDIGLALAVGGCVQRLHRCSTAGWHVDQMVSIEQLEETPAAHVLSTSQWLHDFPSIQLNAELARRFLHGQRLVMPEIVHDIYQVMYAGSLLGTAEWKEGVLHPQHVLATQQEIFDDA
ncbi:MAG: tRNA pseudouridine(55) synthase TruB [Mariprofundaceae bacterium]|nr:tRNA pseudouridine(55) synthase TruB [Mariprofundaceae bacterium]